MIVLLTFVGSPKNQVKYPIRTAKIAEALGPPHSPVIGWKIIELNRLEKCGINDLVHYPEGRTHRTSLRDNHLSGGDSIFIYGSREQMHEFDREMIQLASSPPHHLSVMPLRMLLT